MFGGGGGGGEGRQLVLVNYVVQRLIWYTVGGGEGLTWVNKLCSTGEGVDLG